MKKFLCFLILWLVSHGFVTSQGLTTSSKPFTPGSPDIVFNHLNENDGLSSNIVTGMLQDKDGILWISTFLGLNRYDGKRFEVFKRIKNDPFSLQQNTIYALCEDKLGNIWGSTEDGIFCYEKSKNKFVEYKNQNQKIYPRTDAIVCDQKGQIWAGSEDGLIKLNVSTGHFEIFSHDTINPFSLSASTLRKNSIVVDPNGKGLWIATRKGLNLFDTKTSKSTHYGNTTGDPLFTNHEINALHVSSHGIIWFFDRVTKEIIGFKNPEEGILYKIPIDSMLKSPYGGFIFETSYHHLWYSSNSYETVRIEYLNENKYEIIKNDNVNPSSIAGDYVGAAWEDKDKTVWLGTIAGISRFNYQRMFYRTEKLSKTYPELDENWQITCLAQNPKNQEWWIGSRDGNLYVLDPLTSKSKKIDISTLKNGNADIKFITDLEFIDGQLIICEPYQNTYQYDPNTQIFKKFTALKDEYTNFKIRVIVYETDSTYIFGNNIYQLIRWNKNTGKIQNIWVKNNKAPDGREYMFGWLNGYKGKGIWMSASNHSVAYLHPMDTLLQTFDLPIGMKLRKGGYFNSMCTDKQGNAWFSFSTQGLYKVEKKKERITSIEEIELKFWDSSDGMVNETMLSTIEDNEGRIWGGCLNKFSVLNPIKNSFYNFKLNLSDNNTFYYNYSVLLKNGNILTNIKGDLVEFFTSELGMEYPKNEPILSALQLPDKKLFLSGISQVTLDPHENFLTISFGCMSVSEYYPYYFEYKLEGINETWVISKQKAEATYTNLPAGKYDFKVRAVSVDKVWQSAEKTLTIHIKSPFYNTWWFLGLVVLAAGIFLFYIIQGRLRNIRNINMLKSKAQLLEKEKTSVMYENLKQHLNPHFLFNSLTSLSSLIRLDPKKAGDFLDKMSKVYRYILRNKENESVTLEEELKFVDMYVVLQKTRFEESLIYTIDIPEDMLHRKIVPVTLQNLIENAIKHNTADPDSPLVIEIFIHDDYLIVQNNLQKKNFVETSNKQGQQSMVSLYRFLSQKPVIIEETDQHYKVKIPLI